MQLTHLVTNIGQDQVIQMLAKLFKQTHQLLQMLDMIRYFNPHIRMTYGEIPTSRNVLVK